MYCIREIMNKTIEQLILHAPKVELHIHIEGTLQADMVLACAARNGIDIPYKNSEDIKRKYSFSNLQDFLELTHQIMRVLVTEDDFFDLMRAYVDKARENNIVHAEIFFDAQAHVRRGVALEILMSGLIRGITYAHSHHISIQLIMCVERDLPEKDAMTIVEQVVPYKDVIVAIGLDSAEKDHPPIKFERVFKRALEAGFLTVAHAGEEGPAEYIWQAIDYLHVSRIDHGVHAIDDQKLVHYLANNRIPLTMCPLSNLKLRVVDSLADHPAKKLMDAGVLVTINSDDPAFFGGYLNDNYISLQKALSLSRQDVLALLKNSFTASFLPDDKKEYWIAALDALQI
jgi:adenosine deaminase